MKILCIHCGKAVSTDVPNDTIFRAIAECPECIASQPDTDALITAARALLVAVDYRCNGQDRDVRIRDLWGAAYALKKIEQALTQG